MCGAPAGLKFEFKWGADDLTPLSPPRSAPPLPPTRTAPSLPPLLSFKTSPPQSHQLHNHLLHQSHLLFPRLPLHYSISSFLHPSIPHPSPPSTPFYPLALHPPSLPHPFPINLYTHTHTHPFPSLHPLTSIPPFSPLPASPPPSTPPLPSLRAWPGLQRPTVRGQK